MNSFEPRSMDTHVPPRDAPRSPPNVKNKLWMAGVVALAVAVALLVRRRSA